MKVLIADDDSLSRKVLQTSLAKAGYAVTVAVDGVEALRILSEPDSPRLVVIDWLMPGMDGTDVCRTIRARAAESYVYMVLLTTKDRHEEILEGLDVGADDYVIKPCDLDELTARLRSGARILDLQDQLLSARDELRIKATHDSLTGLYNRGAVLEILQKEVSRSSRGASTGAVIMADLDHFKAVNDTHGHAAGDAVLVEAARRLRTGVRVYDSIGRYGGEEFLVVAPGCGAATGVELAERLRTSLAEATIECPHGAVAVTASFGVAVWPSVEGDDALLKAADRALYKAKDLGRNRVVVETEGSS